MSYRVGRVALAAGTAAVALALGSGAAVASSTDVALTIPEAQKIIQRYLADRADVVTGQRPSTVLSGADAPVSASLRQRLSREGVQLDAVREQLRDTPTGGHRAAEIAVTIDKLTPAKDSGSVEVHAVETTRLYFAHPGQGAPQFEAYRIGHRFTLQQTTGVWSIVDTVPELGVGPPPPTQAKPSAVSWTEAARQDAPASTTGLKPASPRVSAEVAAKTKGLQAPDKLTGTGIGALSPPYDYTAMYNYAIRYWDNYNSEYRNYGNDCTNFISQIMFEGGWDGVTGWPWETDDYSKWWYDLAAAGLTSYSWAGANAWGYFAQVYSQRTTPLAYVDELLVTDVLQVDWDHVNDGDGDGVDDLDHTMFVTGRSGSGQYADEVYLTYHTTDRLNVPFYGWLLPQVSAQNPVWYAHRT
jgi:hypothetical protein